ncbi:MAG: hypothetical protein M3Q63_03000 [bacterium]|nr:hypothetical protein [bacterium]
MSESLPTTSSQELSPEIKHHKQFFKEYLTIQLKLINKYYGFEVNDNQHLSEWISQFGGDYEKAFNKIIQDNQRFIDEYKQDPESALEKIEQELERVHSHA